MLVDPDDTALSVAVAGHRSALEQRPARHNQILGLLTRIQQMLVKDLRFWSFETPGPRALQVGTRSIILGEIARDDEATLAGLVANLPFHGIVGPDDSALRLAKRCEDLGIVFEGSQAQQSTNSNGRHGSRVHPATHVRLAPRMSSCSVHLWPRSYARLFHANLHHPRSGLPAM